MEEWRPIIFTKPEANDALRIVQSKGVTIALDGLSRAKAVEAIDSFLKQYKECFWTIVIGEISVAIREELLKGRSVIDVKLVREVVEYLSNRRGVEKKKEEEEESSEGSGEESEDEEDSDLDLKKEEEEEDEEEEEEIDDLKDDPTTRQYCIEDLLLLSRKKGLSVKEGDEDEILEMMIPHLRGCLMYSRGIKIFLKRVREHMDRCSTLNDLETVKAALENPIFREEYEDWKKDKRLKKNMVPTEEGIAAPVNQIEEEEKRVCRDITEIEEMETLTPLNLPEQAKESTGNAYSCIKESLERAGANKRKRAQI
ncbi:protein OS-9 isoform X2 [Rosa chinensis]|uniref:protein OS-9 isoform X2 n=1 Tax=Rosa chinensis TaxID=74649 RepID=UPI000D09488D|nr:protein OS-9 isoform X2 [Rosa chinensis]